MGKGSRNRSLTDAYRRGWERLWGHKPNRRSRRDRNQMTVGFSLDIGANVMIRGTNLRGSIVGAFVDTSGIQRYSVRKDNNAEEQWFYGRELEPIIEPVPEPLKG